MSSERFWELFSETGDITYYLLYSASDPNRKMTENTERMRREQAQ